VLAALYTPDEASDAHAYEDRLTNDGGSPGLGPSVRLVFSLLLSLRSGQSQTPSRQLATVCLESRLAELQRAREQRIVLTSGDVSSGFLLRTKLFRGL